MACHGMSKATIHRAGQVAARARLPQPTSLVSGGFCGTTGCVHGRVDDVVDDVFVFAKKWNDLMMTESNVKLKYIEPVCLIIFQWFSAERSHVLSRGRNTIFSDIHEEES